MMGASALFIPVLSTMLDVWESVGVRPDRGFVLVEVEAEGRELLLEEGKCPPARGSVFPLRVRSSW